MTVRELLEELRARGVRLQAEGLTLHVDAPAGGLTGELRSALRDNKRDLIRLFERERLRLEEADRRGLIVKWARQPGYVSIHDPTAGEWHEVATSECPPWGLDEAKARRRFGGLSR